MESCGTYLPFFVFVAVTATSPFCEPLCVQTLRFYQIDVEQADAALIVMPNGSRTEGWFEYGTTNPPRSSTRSQSLGRGTSAQSYTHDLSGLRPDTTYFFRAVGKGGGNTTERGSVRSFTTRLTESAPNIEGLWQGQATMQTCENSIQVARFDEFCTQIGQDSFVELSLVQRSGKTSITGTFNNGSETDPLTGVIDSDGRFEFTSTGLWGGESLLPRTREGRTQVAGAAMTGNYTITIVSKTALGGRYRATFSISLRNVQKGVPRSGEEAPGGRRTRRGRFNGS